MGDLHLKPAASDYDLAQMAVPDEVDAALILGDLTHRDGGDDLDLATEFVQRSAADAQTVYVPGNHDPDPFPGRVVDSVDHARVLHQSTLDINEVSVFGWGCEHRTLSPAIHQCAFDALDPRTVPPDERRYEADRIAEELESACFDAVCGTGTVDEAAEELGIEHANRPAFSRGIDEIQATYDRLASGLDETEDVLLASHVPPFNTPVDRHHAVGSREVDKEYLHVGSIALKLAIRKHDVFATLSGHSHEFGFERLDDCEGQPYCLNLGFRGIGTVTAKPSESVFSFTQHATEAQ